MEWEGGSMELADLLAIIAEKRLRGMAGRRATLDTAVRHPLAVIANVQGTLPAGFANTANGTLRTLLNIGSNLTNQGY